MNTKAELILNEIINYVKKYHIMPTRRYLQKKFNYKSVNTITYYIKLLIKENYLMYNNNKKLILSNISYQDDNYKRITVINKTNKYLEILLNKRKKYCSFKIKNNYFRNIGIIKNDYLIVELNSKIKPNNLGLFIIDHKYRIMIYNYKDGFFILKDNEEIILSKIKLIGKVIMVERKI